MSKQSVELAERILAGETLALARAATLVERGGEAADSLLERLHAPGVRAQRIGVTGAPGAGKSTLSAGLTTAWRARGERVGLVAVDPTSPFSGGAVLGDRVRLPRELMIDREVFFRSLATRGALGGLSAAVSGVVDLIAAWGASRVLIETVGVGQSEVDIAAAADTTLLVLQPQTGDDVQALKAGVLEIADLIVIHKADLHGAHDLKREVEAALSLRHLTGAADGNRDVPVILASSSAAPGLDDLLLEIDAHAAWLDEVPEGDTVPRRARRRQAQLEARIHKLAVAMLAAPLEEPAARARRAQLAAEVAAGTTSPAAAARRLIQ